MTPESRRTTDPRLCARMQGVQDPVIPIVGEMVRDNPGTISLGQGVVYYGPPDSVYEGIRSFQADLENHKYKLVQGIPCLLAAIQRKLAQENGMDVEAQDRVVVTAGANMGFMNAVLAVTDPGDEVILPVPYFFNHEMAVTIAGCTPRIVPTDEQYQLLPERIEEAVTEKTRAVVTTSPNNPSGAVYAEDDLRAVNEMCRRRNIYHISDEAYEYFAYEDARVFSPGSIDGAGEHTISLYSLSKAYGFASWRVGYMVIPEDLLDPVRKIQDTILICPPVVCQHAALQALGEGRPYCTRNMKEILDNRRIVREELSRLSSKVDVGPAQGAFYILLRIDSPEHPVDLVRKLVERHKVAVIPGTAFGMEDACSLRVAYGSLRRDTAKEGIGRLVGGLTELLG